MELTQPTYHQQLAGQLLQQVLWGMSLTSGGGGAVHEHRLGWRLRTLGKCRWRMKDSHGQILALSFR